MSLLHRIADSPVSYALRIIVLLVILIAALIGYARAQEPLYIAGFACDAKGVCTTTVDQVQRIAVLLNALVDELTECRAPPQQKHQPPKITGNMTWPASR